MDVRGISVVIPVYNAGEYLRPCLDSVLGQDIDRSLMEIIAIDDGSDDGSETVLDEYAAAHPNIRVIHQPNSGGPGGPRNLGVKTSRREFVFFADADDYMKPEAMRRLYEFATWHACDVVAPKLIGVGRYIHTYAWDRTQVDADLEMLFRTYSPQKLFRRSFILHHGLRFPEGRARFEDGVFVSQAYLLATRASMLGGYDFYFVRARDDGGNRSGQNYDPPLYFESFAIVMETIKKLCPDPELTERLLVDLYRRKGLKPFTPQRYPYWDDARRRRALVAARELAEEHIPPELDARLDYPFRLRSYLVRRGDLDGLVRHTTATAKQTVPAQVAGGRVLVSVDTDPHALALDGDSEDSLRDATASVRLYAELDRVARRPAALALHGRARFRDLRVADMPLSVELREHGSGVARLVPLRLVGPASDGWAAFEACIGSRALRTPREGTPRWSVVAFVDLAGRRVESRLGMPGGQQPRRRSDLPTRLPLWRGNRVACPYRTKHGNLAIRVDPAGVPLLRQVTGSLRVALAAHRRRLRRRWRRLRRHLPR